MCPNPICLVFLKEERGGERERRSKREKKTDTHTLRKGQVKVEEATGPMLLKTKQCQRWPEARGVRKDSPSQSSTEHDPVDILLLGFYPPEL